MSDTLKVTPEFERIAGLVERVTYHNAQNGFCVLRLKVKGIGPVYAGKLVKAFGAAVFDIIEQSPERLRDIPGIGEVRAQKITAGWADQKVIRSIMVFLHAHGVSTSKAVRIFKTYGPQAVEIVQENPYRLAADIRGIGFLSADTIAQKIGIAKDSPLRARAGISYALSEAASQGHCGLPYAELVPLAIKLLEIPAATIEAAIAQEITEEILYPDTVDGEPCVFLGPLYFAEQSIATQIRRLQTHGSTMPNFDANKAIPWVENQLSLQLAKSQQDAIRLALSSKLLVITGGPGVGKTTLVKSILTIMTTKGVKPLLCAPTGRAAKRLTESTGLEAKTIHRLLEVNPLNGQFKRCEDNPLECDLLIADECSMIDVPLANQLLKAVATRTAVIFVGDVDQLPSVGPGQFLADLIDSAAIPVIRLTEVFRQAASSRIIRAAHQINHGNFPTLPEKGEASDFYLVPAEDPEQISQTVVGLVKTRLPRKFGVDPVRDIQVLCPMNRGLTGARGINQALQEALNPPGEGSVDKFGYRFSPGDKVMQIENNYDRDVYNGDIGFVAGIDREEEALTVAFEGREVIYPFGELDELVLCYATTIHKSQGSEYPVVVIPISTQHYMMLKRNLIYTGITRGKQLVVLVGQKKALAMAVKGKQVDKRWSKLRERLCVP